MQLKSEKSDLSIQLKNQDLSISILCQNSGSQLEAKMP